MTQRMQIGDFARLSGLSVKTLRFYADQGLLLPAETDPRSGYRYYLPAQLAAANRVVNLRAVGVSIADIRALLSKDAGGAGLAAALGAQRRRLLAERALIERRLLAVEALASAVERAGPAIMDHVRVAIEEPQFAVVKRARLGAGGPTVTDLFEAVEREVAVHDARAARPPFLVIHEGAPGAYARVAVCAPVRDEAAAALDVEIVGGAHLAVSAVHRGPYDGLAGLEQRLRSFVAQAELSAAGPLREIYHRFGAAQDGYTLPKRVLAAGSRDYVTEIQLPVALRRS